MLFILKYFNNLKNSIIKENNWPDCVKLDGYLKFEPQKGVSLKEVHYSKNNNLGE